MGVVRDIFNLGHSIFVLFFFKNFLLAIERVALIKKRNITQSDDSDQIAIFRSNGQHPSNFPVFCRYRVLCPGRHRHRLDQRNGNISSCYPLRLANRSSKTTLPGLGLIDREYETDQDFDPQREKTQWQRFTHFIDHLNKRDAGKAMYKLIYATRHGQGYHNAKETEVGTAAWEASFSLS